MCLGPGIVKPQSYTHCRSLGVGSRGAEGSIKEETYANMFVFIFW